MPSKEKYKGELPWADRNSSDGNKKAFIAPTETLKEVIKHRPPVSEVVREITKESERDKMRQKEREMMAQEGEREFRGEGKKQEKGEISYNRHMPSNLKIESTILLAGQ